MSDPTTAGEWLMQAIEEREHCQHCGHRKVEHFGQWCRAVVEAVTKDGRSKICCCEGADRDDPELAYLAALKAIVDMHDGPHRCHDHEGTVTIVHDECDTLLAVAEVFRGREGWGRWFA